MRDKWMYQMNFLKLSLAERGFLATLYMFNDHIIERSTELDIDFGPDWLNIAQKLQSWRLIDMKITRPETVCTSSGEWIQTGEVDLRLLHPNLKRRSYHKQLKRKNAQGQDHE